MNGPGITIKKRTEQGGSRVTWLGLLRRYYALLLRLDTSDTVILLRSLTDYVSRVTPRWIGRTSLRSNLTLRGL